MSDTSTTERSKTAEQLRLNDTQAGLTGSNCLRHRGLVADRTVRTILIVILPPSLGFEPRVVMGTIPQ